MRKRLLFLMLTFAALTASWLMDTSHMQPEDNLEVAAQTISEQCETFPTGVGEQFRYLQFLDENYGWGLTAYNLWKTVDGGKSWSELRRSSTAKLMGTQTGLAMKRVQFITPFDGWLLEQNHLLHTTDGGASWQKQEFKQVVIRSFRFFDKDNGWFVGNQFVYNPGDEVPTKHPVIYATSDGGKKWNPVYRGPDAPYPLWDVWPVSSKDIWAVGEFILHSIDGGKSWKKVEIAESSNVDGIPIAVRFLDDNIGWIRTNAKGQYLLTSDGGRSWKSQPVSKKPEGFLDVAYISPTQVWGISGSVPGRTTIYNSHDGGLSWEKVLTNEYLSIEYLKNEKTLIIAGKNIAKCKVR